MGLWLKCPVCQARNPLQLKNCAACDASLENLPPEQRVYVLTPPGAPEEEAKAKKRAPSPMPAVAPKPEPPAHHVPSGPVVVQKEAAAQKPSKPKKQARKKKG